MVVLNEKQKSYIMASLEDIDPDYYPEGMNEKFQELLHTLEYSDKESLNDEEIALAVESLQDFQVNRFCDFDYEYHDIDDILAFLGGY